MVNDFHILLADANTCSRIGLHQVLADAGFYIVAETECLNEFDALMKAHQPHLLLLADNLLPTSPMPFLVNLGQRYPDIATVLLLDHNNSLPLRELIDAGIDGMLLKTASSTVIVQTIQVAAIGGTAFSPDLLSQIMTPPVTPPTDMQDVPLTAREQHLLQLLCADKSNQEMALIISLSRKTVEKGLTALYKKLNVKTRSGAAAWYARRDK